MKIEDFNIDIYIEILKENNLITDSFNKELSLKTINYDKVILLKNYLDNMDLENNSKTSIILNIRDRIYENLFIMEQDNWPRKGINLGLVRMKNLLSILGNPERNLKVIHVGGTNGKGSTCAFIQSILMEGGYNVGMYSSPPIIAENEGIRINKDFIPFEKAYSLLIEIKNKWIEKFGTDDFPSYFEVFTALSILYFNEENVDFAIYEVGLGGRFDATNVFTSKLSIITSISVDHIGVIGDNIEEIAYEKAGIIQENDNVLVYPLDKKLIKIIEDITKDKDGKLEILRKDDIDIEELGSVNNSFSFKNHNGLMTGMIGEHQIYNSSLAIMAIDNLNRRNITNIDENTIIKGLLNTSWPGRLESLSESPRVLIDGAHNEDSVNNLVNYLHKQEYNHLRILMGVLKDKDYDRIFKSLSSLNPEFYLTEVPFEERKMNIDDMSKSLDSYSHNIHTEKNPINALDNLIDDIQKDDLIVITGSLYLISVLRKYILENKIFE